MYVGTYLIKIRKFHIHVENIKIDDNRGSEKLGYNTRR